MTIEYNSGGSTVHVSNKAVNISPIDNISSAPALVSSAYSGTDIHVFSIWNVYSDADGVTEVYTSGTSYDLTTHTAAGLGFGTQYWWSVVHVGISSISVESDLTSFSTINLGNLFGITLGTGNGATQQYITGRDYVARDGLVWGKSRTSIINNVLFDTVRGAGPWLESDGTNAESSSLNLLAAFNNDGFSVGAGNHVNQNAQGYVFWEFLESKGIFDIVAYTGDGIAGKTVVIDLDDGAGSEFGMSIVKELDGTQNWVVQHKSVGGTGALFLNSTSATQTNILYFNNTDATNTSLTVGSTGVGVNTNLKNYISYNFAHNPAKGRFAGSYVGNGASGNKIVTGFPVEWLLIKNITDGTSSWFLLDKVRSPSNPADLYLTPNQTLAEASVSWVNLLDDGFDFVGSGMNTSGNTYIFYAIGTDL